MTADEHEAAGWRHCLMTAAVRLIVMSRSMPPAASNEAPPNGGSNVMA